MYRMDLAEGGVYAGWFPKLKAISADSKDSTLQMPALPSFFIQWMGQSPLPRSGFTSFVELPRYTRLYCRITSIHQTIRPPWWRLVIRKICQHLGIANYKNIPLVCYTRFTIISIWYLQTIANSPSNRDGRCVGHSRKRCVRSCRPPTVPSKMHWGIGTTFYSPLGFEFQGPNNISRDVTGTKYLSRKTK